MRAGRDRWVSDRPGALLATQLPVERGEGVGRRRLATQDRRLGARTARSPSRGRSRCPAAAPPPGRCRAARARRSGPAVHAASDCADERDRDDLGLA